MNIAGKWRKSSRSSGSNGACVEARLSETPELSDSKLANDRPILTVDTPTYVGFIDDIKTGKYGLNRLED